MFTHRSRYGRHGVHRIRGRKQKKRTAPEAPRKRGWARQKEWFESCAPRSYNLSVILTRTLRSPLLSTSTLSQGRSRGEIRATPSKGQGQPDKFPAAWEPSQPSSTMMGDTKYYVHACPRPGGVTGLDIPRLTSMGETEDRCAQKEHWASCREDRVKMSWSGNGPPRRHYVVHRIREGKGAF